MQELPDRVATAPVGSLEPRIRPAFNKPVTPKAAARVRVCHLTSVHHAHDTRIFERECRSLVEAGYDVHLVAPANQSTHDRGVTIVAVPRARGRLSRAIVTTGRVLLRALQIRADVYHFHDPELIPVGLLLRALGKRVIYDAHEDVAADMLDKVYVPRWMRPVLAGVVDVGERLTTWPFSQVVTATPAIARRFPPTRSTVVQNFPLPSELSFAEATPYSSRLPVVAYVGLLSDVRGAVEMVHAMSHVATYSPARLVVAGGFFPPPLETRLRRLDGWRHVEYRGVLPRPAVARTLAEARLGLVLFHPRPNHIESQPNKLFEYMAAGLPVVASRFRLWQEIVEGTQCGLVVDPLDPQAIALAIRWLLEHPAEAEAMGARGRDAVRERFNWRPEEAKLLECYARICGRPEGDGL